MTAERPTPVTVVIPVYNRAFCIADAVRSALDQTPGAAPVTVDVVVVDDGSTDGTAETVDAAFGADPRVRVIRQQNAGPSPARNRGVAEAKSTVVTFLDSDNLMPPDRLGHQVGLLLGPDHPAGVLGGYEVLAMDGVELPEWLARRPDWHSGPFWTSLMTTVEVFQGVGGFDEELRLGEDIDLVVRLRQAGHRIAVTEQPYVLHRFFGDNLSYELSYGEDDRKAGIVAALRRGQAQRRAVRDL
jgi:glycosyltransferase involved in cell wall biosynthesis